MRKLNQKGSIIIFVTLSFALLGTFIGFAVDFSRAYLEKARIARLVDAAALAAAKALKGQTGFEDEATIAACDSMLMNGAPVEVNGTGACIAVAGTPMTFAVNFFDAPVAGGPPTRHVAVTGIEPMPTTFLRFLGWMVPGDFSTLNVSATAQAAPERPVDLMLVLDRSGSMSLQNKLQHMKNAVNEFLDQNFTGNDRIGMVSFATRGCGNSSGGDDFTAITCSPDVPLTPATSSFITTLKNRVNGLDAPGGALTNTMEALRTARPAMAAVFNDPDRALTRKAVLLVTDGKPTVMRRDNDPQCKRDPQNNNTITGWSSGTFSSGCLQGATSTSGSGAFRLTLSGGTPTNVNSSTLFQHVMSCTRSLSSCNAGTNGAMYEADLLRNCGTGNSACTAGGAHDVLVFVIGIGTINNQQPNASFDKHARCLLARVANAEEILNTGPGTVETLGSVCTNPQTPPLLNDQDPYQDLRDGCTGPCTINASQEKGKVYVIDQNGDMPAQLQQVFKDIAATLKLRLTL